ncbi:class D sortase [Clostridium sp.]|uniref:class D sortase n=1 Tax=Clostridium sp. TaxID=1506 RepID=UPI003D6CCA89
MCWAMFNIWEQSHYPDDALPRPNTFDAEQNKLSKDSKVPVESDPDIVLTKPDKNLYPIYPVEGDNIGTLTIPALKRTIPILQGTGDNELKKGVGHFSQSVLPGEGDNCVISGHRETVFRGIGNLKIGDRVIIKTSAGTFTYEVRETRIVHADDKTVIVPTDNAVLTMTTCYPFNFIGSAPDRYIVSADLVKNK